MKQRIAIAILFGLLPLAAAAVASCSDRGEVVEDDASTDATTSPDTSSGDAGVDGSPPLEGGRCSPVRGEACDLVLQDCPSGEECTVGRAGDGGYTTACVNAGKGNRPLGTACCPGQQNQCVPGLVCVGPPCEPDASAPSGRCAPRCCPGDDNICGVSYPEGVRGTCSLTIVVPGAGDAGTPLYTACTYSQACKPFGLQACPPDHTCLLQSDQESFRCQTVFSPPGGQEGDPCTAANACSDGHACLGPPDGGSQCRMLCYKDSDGGTPPPFDAGDLQDAALKGGCVPGRSCRGVYVGAPPWLGFCTP